jgi:hypothetical protein
MSDNASSILLGPRGDDLSLDFCLSCFQLWIRMGVIASSEERGGFKYSCLRSLSQLPDLAPLCKDAFSRETYVSFANFSHNQDDLLPLSLEIRLAPTRFPLQILRGFPDVLVDSEFFKTIAWRIKWLLRLVKLRMSSAVLCRYFCMQPHQTHFMFDQFI